MVTLALSQQEVLAGPPERDDPLSLGLRADALKSLHKLGGQAGYRAPYTTASAGVALGCWRHGHRYIRLLGMEPAATLAEVAAVVRAVDVAGVLGRGSADA